MLVDVTGEPNSEPEDEVTWKVKFEVADTGVDVALSFFDEVKAVSAGFVGVTDKFGGNLKVKLDVVVALVVRLSGDSLVLALDVIGGNAKGTAAGFKAGVT